MMFRQWIARRQSGDLKQQRRQQLNRLLQATRRQGRFETLESRQLLAGDFPSVVSIQPSEEVVSRYDTETFDVAFDEEVSGVDLTDFVLNVSEGTSARLDAVQQSDTDPSVFHVAVYTGTVSTNLSLSLVDDDSIVSLAGQPLGGAGVDNGNFEGVELMRVDPTASVSGVVFEDVNNNGTFDEGELPVRHIWVYADANADGQYGSGERRDFSNSDNSSTPDINEVATLPTKATTPSICKTTAVPDLRSP